MNANGLLRALSLLALASTAILAQVGRERDRAPLKHWAAPLYWQPTGSGAGERSLSITSSPEGALALPGGATALVFVGMTPCRVVDTRAGQGFPGSFGLPALAGGTSRTFPIPLSANCTIPTIAQAYSFNITVVPPGPLGFITAYPTGQPLPLAATLNSLQGFIVGNAAVVPAGTNGSIDIFASNPTDIVIDINGYYAPLGSVGLGSLSNNNTAIGDAALSSNTGGLANTAVGSRALAANTTGNGNSATGYLALQANTTGGNNTAIGLAALKENTTGISNTAVGSTALPANTTGVSNTATGYKALAVNITGSSNTAIGDSALLLNTASNNTAVGRDALSSNTTGNSNIALGLLAGSNVTTTSNNIFVGNAGSAGDSGTIRIGTSQSSYFAAGIRGVTTANNNAIPVVIDSAGQLGTISSSRRFKEEIEDMGAASGDLLRLRPVTFRYKESFADGSKPIQYGLIAEEVAEVYPDLVARSADGQIETVKYQVLDSMLLNELQKEHQQNQQQAETIQLLQNRLAALEALLSGKTPPSGHAVGQ
jgi:Chaperone of endosialidase